MESVKIEKIKRIIVMAIILVIALIVATYSPLNPLYQKGITTDQAVFFTIAKGILNGKLAYVDFFDHKGPFLYLILALGLKIPENFWGNFIIEFICIVISVYFMYKIANLYTNKVFSLMVVGMVFASDITLYTTSNSEEYIFPLLVVSIYLFLKMIRTGINNIYVFIIGVCGMLTFFIKYNYCLIWACLGILLFVLMLEQKYKIKDILKMCLSFAGGMFVSSIPFLMYLVGTGSFKAFLDTYILYSFQYADATGITERINCVKFLLNTSLIYPMLIFVIGVIIFACLFLVARNKRDTLKEKGFFNKEYIYSIVLSIAIIVITASPGQSWYYYKQTTMIIYIVPLAVITNWIIKLFVKTEKNHLINKIIAHVIVFTIAGIFLLKTINISDYKIEKDDRYESAIKIARLIDDNCSSEDTIISYANDCTIYFLVDQKNASRIFFPSATIVNDALIDELMNDLNENKPKAITYTVDWENGMTDRAIESAKIFTEENYRLVYEDEYRKLYFRNK